jgi:hypothetical protein
MQIKSMITWIVMLLSFSDLAVARVLDTPNYLILIKVNCSEGSVACYDVIYEGKSKRTNKLIKLQGETIHSLCSDGITPCQFIGYKFRNKGTIYYVNEDGSLRVISARHKVVVNEQGQWRLDD